MLDVDFIIFKVPSPPHQKHNEFGVCLSCTLNDRFAVCLACNGPKSLGLKVTGVVIWLVINCTVQKILRQPEGTNGCNNLWKYALTDTETQYLRLKQKV